MWAAEIKKIDVEGLPKWEEKDLFKCAASFPYHFTNSSTSMTW
jgi:hypothetical protein